MSWMWWILAIYLTSVIGLVKLIKLEQPEVKENEIGIIMCPIINTLCFVALFSFFIVEKFKVREASKCMVSNIAKLFNKL